MYRRFGEAMDRIFRARRESKSVQEEQKLIDEMILTFYKELRHNFEFKTVEDARQKIEDIIDSVIVEYVQKSGVNITRLEALKRIKDGLPDLIHRLHEEYDIGLRRFVDDYHRSVSPLFAGQRVGPKEDEYISVKEFLGEGGEISDTQPVAVEHAEPMIPRPLATALVAQLTHNNRVSTDILNQVFLDILSRGEIKN